MATWTIQVVRSGTYELDAQLSCGSANAGCVLSVECGDRSVSHKIMQSIVSQPILGPERTERYEVSERYWESVRLGTLFLEEGSSEIIMRVRNIKNASEFSLKSLSVKEVK